MFFQNGKYRVFVLSFEKFLEQLFVSHISDEVSVAVGIDCQSVPVAM